MYQGNFLPLDISNFCLFTSQHDTCPVCRKSLNGIDNSLPPTVELPDDRAMRTEQQEQQAIWQEARRRTLPPLLRHRHAAHLKSFPQHWLRRSQDASFLRTIIFSAQTCPSSFLLLCRSKGSWIEWLLQYLINSSSLSCQRSTGNCTEFQNKSLL